ncbi:carboxypeptidase regulatory-like domain-containing protein [Caenimonas sedimenti]|uniref:Carboxypeptidase regulatory-like domain-containing protein n=1 Tax=Caenimonas sedimenti TaxID=2596921 RepID=A0A562ZYD2_9BURK|nr:carboxypeptidase regulatory-like domain-containing protein [Caenimonas sedimenti]TWO73184.1 carboxypeptidase regulatory-like domain-containing protein [Caenimonas sedimenti]
MRKFLFALAAVPAMALAQAPTATSPAAYRCGGVGQDEQQAMKAQAASHDAMLTFAVDNGAYLADVEVQIRDARGATVLQARCGGPLMLVDLPQAGHYLITATAKGQTLRRSAQIGGGGKPERLAFIWPVG